METQDERAVRRSEFCAWGVWGDAVPPQKARRERARKRLLRSSRVDKAHYVRSADAGSFARDYSLALPACYARDVLHP